MLSKTEKKTTTKKTTKNTTQNYTTYLALIVLVFNDTSNLVGHFVLSPTEKRRNIEEIVEEMKERDRGERGT